ADPPALHRLPTRRSSDLRSSGVLRHCGNGRNWHACSQGQRAPLPIEPLCGAASPAVAREIPPEDLWRPGPPSLFLVPFEPPRERSEEHTSELQSRENLVC